MVKPFTCPPTWNHRIMKQISLTQGKVAIVDDEDFDRLNAHKWYAHKNRGLYYAARHNVVGNKRGIIYMHREILGVLPGLEIDHKNGNGLDNRRVNLRICTHSDNQRNRGVHKGEKRSRFKGVSWDNRGKKWRARIGCPQQYLGYFDSEIEAARQYDEKAEQLFGKFARLNFPKTKLRRTRCCEKSKLKMIFYAMQKTARGLNVP